MPINMVPGRTFPIVLKADEDKDPKPTFLFRYLSCDEFCQMAELHDKLLVERKTKSAVSLMIETIGFACVGWENMGDHFGDYSKEKLGKMLVLGEAQELSGKAMMKQRLSEDDRGNSPSPSPSSSASSAEPAAAASAETSPAN